MTHIVIDKKKYVLIPEKDYNILQKKASSALASDTILTIKEARKYSKKLITQWNHEKYL